MKNEKQGNKKQNISRKAVLIVAILAIIGVGSISFGYFTVQRISNSVGSISGRVQKKGPKITYKENKEGMTIKDSYPMSDELGESSDDAYVFSVKNEENKEVSAKIVIEVTKKSTLDDSLINISLNGTVVTLSSLTKEKPTSGYKSAYVLKTEKLTPGKEAENTLKVWINENGTKENAASKEWAGSILVVPEFA